MIKSQKILRVYTTANLDLKANPFVSLLYLLYLVSENKHSDTGRRAKQISELIQKKDKKKLKCLSHVVCMLKYKQHFSP